MLKTKKIFAVLFWIAVWQAVYMAVGKEVLFPSFADTVKALFILLGESEFYKTILFTFIRIISGFVLGMAAGVILGILTSSYGILKEIFMPLINIVRAAPVASFIILALAWIKTGMVPVFISFLIVVPVMWSNINEGIASTDNKLLEMAKVFGFSLSQKIKKIYIPSVMPYFRSAAITGSGLAFKSGVAAEVIASPIFSVGQRLYDAKVYMETAELFAWTAVVIILSIAFEKLLVRFIGR